MVLAVDQVGELLSSVFIGFHHGADVLLDLSVGDATLERSILSLESGANVLSNLGEVDNLTLSAVSDALGNERFTGKGLSEDDAPLGLVAEVLVEAALAPVAHRLETVILLQESVDGVDAETVVNDFNDGSIVLTTSSEDNSSDPAALSLELLALLDSVREVGEDKLVAALDT